MPPYSPATSCASPATAASRSCRPASPASSTSCSARWRTSNASGSDNERGPPRGSPLTLTLRADRSARNDLGSLLQTGEHAVRCRLPGDELRAPGLAAMKRFVESAVIGADREEPDRADPERKPEDEPDHERFRHFFVLLFPPDSTGPVARRTPKEQPACHMAPSKHLGFRRATRSAAGSERQSRGDPERRAASLRGGGLRARNDPAHRHGGARRSGARPPLLRLQGWPL